MNDRFPMTPIGEKTLIDELTHLKKVERPVIITAIADARDHGDAPSRWRRVRRML